MIKTTREQRVALFRVFQRDFPSWVSPGKRRSVKELGTLPVPTIQWRKFRKTVQGGSGCIMLPWKGMWLGIEPDGYTHS
jgi:hypothetical protein